MLFVLVLCLALLAGCAAPPQAPPTVTVVLEQNAAYTADTYVQTVPRGQTVRFAVQPAEGQTLIGVDHDAASLTLTTTGYQLTLEAPRYSTVLSLTARPSGVTMLCHPNGAPGEAQPVPAAASHLRFNTPSLLFERPGYTLIGWNTAADGSGRAIGLGSRAALDEAAQLYAQWAAWTPAEQFTYQPTHDGVAITGYTGQGSTVVVPAELDGQTVTEIAANAFAGANCERVILSATLRRLADGAFADCALRELTLFDSIQTLSDRAFTGCGALQTLHLNAVEAPVYSGTYYDTFADKYDRLVTVEGPRLVLFSGSSTRFGYDSDALQAAYPAYHVVNMGVFAYSNALPQMLLLLDAMQPGDVLIHAPEFDAAQRQFCTKTTVDAAFFNMMEANYDMIARLDLRKLDGVFTALQTYLQTKSTLPPRSYALCAADFDEDGNPVDSPSYNAYGDYCLYRPNAADDAPVYGLPVDYTAEAFPAAQFLQPLRAVYAQFAQKGVAVYFTYAPRNQQALSEASTPEARAALDAHLRTGLGVPFLGGIEDSLWPGRYLYGTDNHLSTEGASLRTAQLIHWLEGRL